MRKDVKFRFVDEMCQTYGPLRIIDLVEQAKYCAKHPHAVFVEGKDTDYLRLAEFCRGLRSGEIVAEQYTGYDDRDGEEIYEGDILEEEICDTVKEGSRIERYKVEWDETTLIWSLNPSSDLHDELWETNKTRKVIGNIHENPELLKGER